MQKKKKDMTNHHHVQWPRGNDEKIKKRNKEIGNQSHRTDDECCNLANLNDQINA